LSIRGLDRIAQVSTRHAKIACVLSIIRAGKAAAYAVGLDT
jgi:hypothetical protein